VAWQEEARFGNIFYGGDMMGVESQSDSLIISDSNIFKASEFPFFLPFD
jgi:hypothetical protein